MAKVQPPPRRVKHAVVLKDIHSEQLSKLQRKHQQESELLEDLRNFSKQRSMIEKEYATALCKLGQQYASKRTFHIPKVVPEDGKEHKLIAAVWKTVLAETERVGKMRLIAAENYMHDIFEPTKPLKIHKQQMSKKVIEQCSFLQKEVAITVAEMIKSQKVYNEDEHISHEARVKFNEADSKVKNKSTGLFTSMASLQQKCSKLAGRRDLCEVKSTATRNDYLLSLASSNAHQIRYYSTDLPELMKMLDGEVFDKVREFFITLARNELECCGLTQECFTKIMADSALISRQYNLQCFLHENHVYTDLVQYKFEQQDNDQVVTVCADHQAEEFLVKEAKRCAMLIAKENKSVRRYQRELHKWQERAKHSRKPSESTKDDKKESKDKEGETAAPDPELKVDELKQEIRKSETDKMKAEARIEALRKGGINVDSILSQVMAEIGEEEEEEEEEEEVEESQPLSSATASVSRTDSEGPQSRTQSTVEESRLSQSHQPADDSTYINYEEDDDYVDETFNPATTHDTTQDTTTWPCDTTTATSTMMSNHDDSGSYTTSGLPIMCMALYDFQASNNDELTMVEHEQLELVSEGEGDGWVKARKSTGEVGFVPQNYIQILDTTASGAIIDKNEVNVDGESMGYNTMTSQNAGVTPQSPPITPQTPPTYGERVSAYSATDYEVQQTMDNNNMAPAKPPTALPPTDLPEEFPTPVVEPPTPQDGQPDSSLTEAMKGAPSEEGMWATALYDYEAQGDDELSFHAGQLIRILRKEHDGVDDGFWEGIADGKSGVFPSLVVMELEAMDSESIGSPMGVGPPPFTPPEPGPLPPSLEITIPTPSDDGPTPPGKSPEDELPPPVGEAGETSQPGGGVAPAPTNTDPPPDDDLPPPPPPEQLNDEQNDNMGEADTNSPPPPATADRSSRRQRPHVVVSRVQPRVHGQDPSADVVKVARTDGVVVDDEENGESII